MKRCSPPLPSSSCLSRRLTALSPLFWSLLMTARSSCCAGNRSRSSTTIRPPSPAENTAFWNKLCFPFFSQPLTTQKERQRLFLHRRCLSFSILDFSVIAPSRRTLWQGVPVSFHPGRCGNPQTHSRCTSAVPSPALPRCPTKRTPAYAAYER